MSKKLSTGDRIFQSIVVFFMLVVGFVTLYPIWHIFMGSFSDAYQLKAGGAMVLWFKGFSLDAYRTILRNPMIWISYRNTAIYSILGTALNMFMTTIAAYSLSRKGLIGANVIMKLLVFTMYFGGGLIPTYLVYDKIGLVNNWLVMVLPGMVSVYNMIVIRTAFLSFPKEIEEAAVIDGAGPIQILVKVILPIILSTMMVICLWYFVGHWNAYYDGMIYLRDRNLFPLQLVLRDMLIDNNVVDLSRDNTSFVDVNLARTIKYAAIMVALIPVMAIYPFIQKYFVSGVMIGSIKG